MLQHHHPRIQRQRASKPHFRSQQRTGFSCRRRHVRWCDADLCRELSHTGLDVLRDRIHFQAEGDCQVLRNRHRFEQRDSIADEAELLYELQPDSAVDDGGCRPAEGNHLTFVRKNGAGDEVDEGFRRRQVQAHQRGAGAGRDSKIAHAKRPQRAVLLFDVVQLQRGCRVRHSATD